ncbi:MAG TPA: metalloprotease PmbA [Candidatus Binatia bacterium]|nr:metalloprotease PmbA [Candidatus Binatia bacterium]
MNAPHRFELPERSRLEPVVLGALERAKRAGATQSEADVSESRGLSVSVRKGEIDTVEFHHDRGLSVTVFFGQRSGSASTADTTERGLAQAVDAACAIAQASGDDPCSGLADPARMATQFPDLDLDHAWPLGTDEAIERARATEAAALAVDARITQSEGASVHTSRGIELYANSHGFVGERRGANHYVSCAVIAVDGEEMQRDDWYTSGRHPGDLEDVAQVGRRAGERAVARLGSRGLSTRTAPVLFTPDAAKSLFGHLLAAISGGALYRRASFLLDHAGREVFAPLVTLREDPFIRRGAGSAAFDGEGVATQRRVLVDAGVLQGYLLGSYSARKLGLQSTGNAGGVHNLVVQPGTKGFDDLVRDMGEGLVVTELMGQGVNTVTGDYSRGAAGFWVERGAIAFPVEEITIAGNLAQMYRSIRALGSDVDVRSGIRTPSVLIEPMTIAGQ